MKTVFNALNFNSWTGEPKLPFGLYRNSRAKIWGKIKVFFGLRCRISPQRFLFTNRLWPLSNVYSRGATVEREEAKPTSLFSPLNSTRAAISMKHRRAGRDVWLPVSKAGGIICKERLRFALAVAVAVAQAAADRKHFPFVPATTAPRPARGAQAAAGPAPRSSPAASHSPRPRPSSRRGLHGCPWSARPPPPHALAAHGQKKEGLQRHWRAVKGGTGETLY